MSELLWRLRGRRPLAGSLCQCEAARNTEYFKSKILYVDTINKARLNAPWQRVLIQPGQNGMQQKRKRLIYPWHSVLPQGRVTASQVIAGVADKPHQRVLVGEFFT